MNTKTWFTSDSHFGHANILVYCKRPYADIDSMDRDLIERWNSVVGPLDTVYHLGDFSLGKKSPTEYLRKLRGKRKILVRGNHDRSAARMLAYGFDEVVGKTIYQDWVLQHHPIKTDKKLLCGHIHQHWRRLGWTVNVGVDVWGFAPRTLTEIESCPQDEFTTYRCACGEELDKLGDNKEHYEHRK